MCEPLNHIHQDMKSVRLIAVCKRTLNVALYTKKAGGKNCRGNLPRWRIDDDDDLYSVVLQSRHLNVFLVYVTFRVQTKLKRCVLLQSSTLHLVNFHSFVNQIDFYYQSKVTIS